MTLPDKSNTTALHPRSTIPHHLTGVEQRQDVRVLEVGGDLDLSQETLGSDHRSQCRLQNLDCEE